MSALDVALRTPWSRQGEWGGTTLSRSLIYAGMQRTLPEWTGVREGYEAFLHCGDTTYIATGQYERFAAAALTRFERERAPLRAFAARFDALLAEVRTFLPTLKEQKRHAEKIAEYMRLHQHMQPYSYVFGYGEDQVVGELLDRTLRGAGLEPLRHAALRRAATSPLHDADADVAFARARHEGVDARALDLAGLVRQQLQVRTDRRILWNKVEEAMRPHLAARAERAALPVRLLLEATPGEMAHGLPPRATLEARIGTTFLAHRGEVHLLGGEEHARVLAHVSRPPAPVAPQELRGQAAFPGLVRGRVRLVLTTEQGDALQRGEILVSDMTTPDLTLACSRAAAIVTDRGGILCHAALVAREFQIPTVLATEEATRVLRDGDLVEVDAHRGTVRVVEKET